MSSSGEEEETGPSVDSNDPEERIAARRLRIQRRIELTKRAAMGEDPNDKKEVKEEMSKSRKQIEESRLRLTKLRQDGSELVSNIRVAGDAREGIRRIEEEDAQRQRKEKLEAEAKAGAERFEEITKKWESALQKEIPQDLHDMLMQQKQACDAMIDEKNKLINDFQLELKGKDDQYVKDLKKQAEDIDLMIERMEEQIKNVTTANRQELDEIEKAFITERSELLELQRKKWETSMQQRRDKEIEFMKMRERRVEDFEKQLQHLRIIDSEEYNKVKIKLETDVQILEQQLQQMRATYQLNQEKLEYNFQVLKKRDEENTITKSQQKRKITRLQDVLNILKIKLQKQEKQFRDENQALTDDYKRIKEQFKELQKKSIHFAAADAQKFNDIWCMNEQECKDLLSKVLEQDRIVTEHQLGLQFIYPDVAFTDNVGPIMVDPMAGKGASAMQVVQDILASTANVQSQETVFPDNYTTAMTESNIGELDENMEKKSTITAKISARTIKQVLELLCDEGGFLIENKLNKLLAPLEKDERSLMKLDAIFAALGVDTEEDIFKLSTYFLNYLKEQEQKQDADSQFLSKEDVELDMAKSGQQPAETDAVDPDAELQKVVDAPSDDVSVHESIRSEKGGELIHPNDATRALRAFVEDNKKQIKNEQSKQPQFKITSNEERDNSLDAEYWAKYPAVLTDKTERVWDALIDGLEKYSEVLTTRGDLIQETDGLRQQNAELRMLLHQYVNSKVNAELEIPPTRVLQMEFNPM